MRASLRGREELVMRVQQALALSTKKEAEHVVNVVICGLESTLLNNLREDGFTLKLGSFGKFSVRHKPGILRKIPFTGKTILTKRKRKIRFISLGSRTAGPHSGILVAGAVRRDVNGARIGWHYSIMLALVIDGHRQPLLITLRRANVLCFTSVPPERRPSGRRRVQKIVRGDS
jgi:nucleoid DNA-binding protein